MMDILLALAPIASVVFLSEYLWRSGKMKGEEVRKLVHISSGCYLAIWPYIISIDQIKWIGICALIVGIASRTFSVFTSVDSVQRKTYGDLFFAVSVFLCAVLADNGHVFTVAMLIMALPDGIAALTGRRWGSRNNYKVFGSSNLNKSMVGTASYIGVSLVILGAAQAVGFLGINGDLLNYWVFLPVGLAVVENIMPYGLDNLATPLFATLVLNSLV